MHGGHRTPEMLPASRSRWTMVAVEHAAAHPPPPAGHCNRSRERNAARQYAVIGFAASMYSSAILVAVGAETRRRRGGRCSGCVGSSRDVSRSHGQDAPASAPLHRDGPAATSSATSPLQGAVVTMRINRDPVPCRPDRSDGRARRDPTCARLQRLATRARPAADAPPTAQLGLTRRNDGGRHRPAIASNSRSSRMHEAHAARLPARQSQRVRARTVKAPAPVHPARTSVFIVTAA